MTLEHAQRPEEPPADAPATSVTSGNPSPRPWVVALTAFAALGLAFALGIAFGYGAGRNSAQAAAAPSTPDTKAPAAQTHCPTCPTESLRASAALSSSFHLFWEAMDLLYRDFHGELPEPEEMTAGAIQGVLNEIDDPNTSFLSPEEADFFRSTLEGQFEGIGARAGWDDEADTLVILEPFANQPAWEAGLRRQDRILAVDGESVVGTDLNHAIELIRGPEDTPVRLTVQRAGGDPFGVIVVRDRIEVPTISTDSLGEAGDIAYIRLTTFNENAGALMREAVRSALERDPRGLVLDLRGNGGGLLREAVKITSIFLQSDLVLSEHFGSGEVETYETTTDALTTDLPMVVLVDGASASASEIVAGALQDAGRAALIGETTFGKGSVQRPHTLSNGAILRVTIARWYTPRERTIEGTGLTPDRVVEMTNADRRTGDDPQLEAAQQYLLAPPALPAAAQPSIAQ